MNTRLLSQVSNETKYPMSSYTRVVDAMSKGVDVDMNIAYALFAALYIDEERLKHIHEDDDGLMSAYDGIESMMNTEYFRPAKHSLKISELPYIGIALRTDNVNQGLPCEYALETMRINELS